MCGSGTLLIEAALMLKKVAPGTLRKRFAFQKFAEFKPELWDKLVTESLSAKKSKCQGVHLYGYDVDSPRDSCGPAKCRARRR
jgi:23S rRNA G2445 N2-methylase RlmL